MGNNKVKDTNKLLVSGVLILTISNVLVKLMGAFLKVPLADIIGNNGMGLYNGAYQIYVWLYTVSTTGIPVAVALLVSEARSKGNFAEARMIYKLALRLMVFVGFVSMMIMIIFSKIFSENLFRMSGMVYPIIAIAPTLFFVCISGAIRGYFQGYQYMVPTSISELIETAGKVAFGLLFASLAVKYIPDLSELKDSYAAAATILGLTIGAFLGTIYLLIRKKTFKEDLFNKEYEVPESATMVPRPSKEIVKSIIIIAIPIIFSSSVMSLSNMLDSIIISRRLQDIGPDAYSMFGYSKEFAAAHFPTLEKYAEWTSGYFQTQVYTLFNLPPTLIYPISESIVPYLKTQITLKQFDKASDTMDSSLKIGSMIAMPCAAGLCVLAEPVIRLLFNSTFDPHSVLCLRIQAFAVFFLAIQVIQVSFLQANRKERLPIIRMLVGAVIKIILDIILIGNGYIQIYGASISTLVFYIILVGINMYFVKKHVHYMPKFRKVFLRPLLATIICAAAAYFSYILLYRIHPSYKVVILSVVIAVIVYFFAIFLVRAVTKEDLKLLPKSDKIIAFLTKLHLLKG